MKFVLALFLGVFACGSVSATPIYGRAGTDAAHPATGAAFILSGVAYETFESFNLQDDSEFELFGYGGNGFGEGEDAISGGEGGYVTGFIPGGTYVEFSVDEGGNAFMSWSNGDGSGEAKAYAGTSAESELPGTGGGFDLGGIGASGHAGADGGYNVPEPSGAGLAVMAAALAAIGFASRQSAAITAMGVVVVAAVGGFFAFLIINKALGWSQCALEGEPEDLPGAYEDQVNAAYDANIDRGAGDLSAAELRSRASAGGYELKF